jgi:hypothetical protein
MEIIVDILCEIKILFYFIALLCDTIIKKSCLKRIEEKAKYLLIAQQLDIDSWVVEV